MGSSLWRNGEQQHTSLPRVGTGTPVPGEGHENPANKSEAWKTEGREEGDGNQKETIAEIKCHRDNYFQLTVVGQS